VTLYSRSDVQSVSIPVERGGCGVTHSRPSKNGVPVRMWALTCEPREGFLRGSRRGVVKSPVSKSGYGSLEFGIIDGDPDTITGSPVGAR